MQLLAGTDAGTGDTPDCNASSAALSCAVGLSRFLGRRCDEALHQ